MADAGLVQRAKTLLDQLSENPRFAGSAEETRVRAICRDELQRAGYECRERAFEFSDWPARWGMPLAALIQLLALLATIRLSMNGRPGTGLFVALMLLAIAGGAGRWVRRRGVLRFPFGRARSVNLEAARGIPSVWLVAHLDSKSQTVPMLVRIASTVAFQAATVLVLTTAGLAMGGAHVTGNFWNTIAVVMMLSALPSIFCFVGNKSSGAVDNASGVVSILLAASSYEARRDLGVLITSGEELGLAGARAWRPLLPYDVGGSRELTVLNCDTVDDGGGWRCMYSGARPESITAAAETVGRTLGLPIQVGRLIPGILADNVAFADAGIRSVTVSRGNFSTLARIHTRRDNSTGMTGQGAARASDLLSALAKELT
jgi:hypothetical protein